MKADEAIAAWSQPGATDFIHPTRGIDEAAYWASGKNQAALIGSVLPDGCKVMDFGCGDGRVAIPLRVLGYDVTAVDGSASMVEALAVNEPARSPTSRASTTACSATTAGPRRSTPPDSGPPTAPSSPPPATSTPRQASVSATSAPSGSPPLATPTATSATPTPWPGPTC